MAEVVIPEIKHEYIRQVDTETTKNDWFDECIADNKEAAWAGIGTGELDSQYQPSPVKEPDYYMQYCSSDDYDYLKDYRLIWGYGIGIIEQDVICSLSTGEHLAEGKDACDTYATENAAGENTDWKRGTWIKFSGNRNVSPTRIGEVILPERVISLKDLCAALTLENPCDFYLPQENSILNAQNLCGTKTNSPITLCLSDEAGMPFGSTLNLSYAFAYTDARIWQFDTYGVDESYMFYHAKIGQLVVGAMDVTCNYTSKFEEAIGNGESVLYPMVLDKAMFKNSTNLIIETTATARCREDVSECFYGCDIYMDITGIDFSNARNVQNMFYRVNVVEDEIDLDLSSFVEHDDDVEDRFSNFFYTDSTNKIINITAPTCKLKGFDVFKIYSCIINIINNLICYDYSDKKDYVINDKVRAFFYSNRNKIIGNFVGAAIFTNEENASPLTNDSNVVISSEENINLEDTLKYYLNDASINFFPAVCLYNNGYYQTGTGMEECIDCINLDNYYFPTQIIALLKSQLYNQHYSSGRNYSANINKSNKEFCIIYGFGYSKDYNITINENSSVYMMSNTGVKGGNYYPYTDNDDYRLNIINESEISVDINTYPYNIGNIAKIYQIYANNCNIKSLNAFNWKRAQQVAYRIIELNNLDITNFERILFTNFNILNEIIINKEREVNMNSLEYNGYVYVGNLSDKELTIRSNYVYNNINIIPFIIVDGSTQINKINLIHDNGNYDYQGVLARCNNFKYSDIIKGYAYHIDKRYMYFNCNKDYITNTIDDLEDKVINYGNSNFNAYNNFDLAIDLSNYTININNLAVGDYFTILSNYLGNNKMTANNTVFNINDTRNKYYRFYNIVSNNLTLNINTFTELILDEDLTGTLILNGNGKSVKINSIGIENLTMCNISNSCNISLCSKLTQESINSIVNPINYTSGCTLTINTIPFQYITEEQKQALVAAGVTLVEYIPTETTE